MPPISPAIPGYPMLARRMSVMPEAAIFRRFGEEGILGILYLQAELTTLSENLRKLQQSDHEDKSKGYLYAQDWESLMESAETGNGEQLKLVQELTTKVTTFHKALIRMHTIATLPNPDAADLKHIQLFLESKQMGMCLKGADCETWGSKDSPHDHAPDLASLRARQQEDLVSGWIRARAVEPFFQCIGHRFQDVDPAIGFHAYKDSHIAYISQLFRTIMASALLIGSISIPNLVSSIWCRLGVIAAFTLLFSFSLTVFARCKSSETFAITAAFAAVQAVFIATNSVSNTNGATPKLH